MGRWHTETSRSIQEDLGGLGYLSFQDDQGDQEDLLNLWTPVDRFWILLVDLGGLAVLEVLEIQYLFRLSLLANLVHLGVPASLGCRGILAVPQGLVLLWLPHCQGALGDLVGLAGCDWSGNRLESDSASD